MVVGDVLPLLLGVVPCAATASSAALLALQPILDKHGSKQALPLVKGEEKATQRLWMERHKQQQEARKDQVARFLPSGSCSLLAASFARINLSLDAS